MELENGFVEDVPGIDVAPKRISPISPGASGFVCNWNGICFDSTSPFFPPLSLAEVSNTVTALSARTLPSFRLHVFRRHINTYSRLPCLGKISGRLPFNCKSSTMMSLHTLQRASAADGGMDESNHVYEALIVSTTTYSKQNSRSGPSISGFGIPVALPSD